MMKFSTYAAAIAAAICLSTAALGETQQPTRDSALYEQLGGKTGIRKFTHRFLEIVLADDRIKSKFDDANIDRLEGLLAEQFCDLSGGPCQYSGKDMHAAHKGMGINTAEFNALAEDLQIAMSEAGISSRASNRLISKLAPMYHDVVTK
jgi:hemoglobin